MVIVIPSWNNKPFCKDNVHSVFMQHYDNYEVIYIDDCSTDGTADIVLNLVKEKDQLHRWRIIRNPVRRGILYNHYMAVHMCPNDAIIVNLDGDDYFAHKDVLKRVNEAYQKDILMTHGQYREYPKGRQHVGKKIPSIIHAHRAYRYYDWISSHLRTFYAGLFKAIPLGYFLYKDGFIPSAIDHAMMFAMLELSGGRVHFIDEVLYNYNFINPNTTFRTMLLTDMAMAHICRGQEPLAPLTYDPRIPETKETNIRLAVICFCESDEIKTKQWYDSFMKSSLASYDIYIVHETDSEYADTIYDFIGQKNKKVHIINSIDNISAVLKGICDQNRYSHLLLMSDEYVITNKSIDIQNMVRLLHKTHAAGFYMARGKNDTYNKNEYITRPSLIEFEPGVYAWKFSKASGPWRFAYSYDCVLYRTKDIHRCICQSSCTAMQELKEMLYSMSSPLLEDVGICFESTLCS